MHQFALKSLCKYTYQFSVLQKIKQVSTPCLLVTHLYEGILKEQKENPLLGQGVGQGEGGRKGPEYTYQYPHENSGLC